MALVVIYIHIIIDTSPVSTRETDDCKKVFKENFSIEASDMDCDVVRRVCEAVSTRAARLAASGIVALVKKINKIDGCSVAVDGSLYKLHPKFPERYICVQSTIIVLFEITAYHKDFDDGNIYCRSHALELERLHLLPNN